MTYSVTVKEEVERGYYECQICPFPEGDESERVEGDGSDIEAAKAHVAETAHFVLMDVTHSYTIEVEDPTTA